MAKRGIAEKKGKKDKRGALEISFGMIFSIILIIAFIGAAFYVIRFFLNIRSCAETGTFHNDLKTSIENAWRSPETSQIFTSFLPTSIEKVCFIDVNSSAKGQDSELYSELTLYDKNLVLYPPSKACSGLQGVNVEHLNLGEITSSDNPYCIKVEKGKVSLKIEKGIYDRAVKIS